tara:strand:+ start:609 stop:2324 length:1716 start_codon:yes stop_codon:yes gene_type:complete
MNLDEINPVDKIKKGFNTFKNGFKGKSKEGFSNDELSTEENAYLSNIDKHPKFAVKTQPTDTVTVGYADLNGEAKVKITFSDINKTSTDWEEKKMRTVTGLTITNIGTGSNYKAGDTIVITTDKIMNSDAPDSIKVATDETKEDEENALRFTITDTSENDWGKFISELISLFILLILFSIIGANIVHLSNLPMSAINILLPSDWNSAPYKGEYSKGYDLFKKLNESETKEDLLEFLFPMKSVSFPYSYDNMYKNEQLDDLGLAFYVIWPLKWLARTTAWAWSTGRLLIKYFITLLKWIMKLIHVKSDSVIFFLGPFILMFALSTQLTTMIGFILMYIGGFMTDVKDGWMLAIFALMVFIIALGGALWGVLRCCQGCVHFGRWCVGRKSSDEEKASKMPSPQDIAGAAMPFPAPPSEKKSELGEGVKSISLAPARMISSLGMAIGAMIKDIFGWSCLGPTLKGIIMMILGIIVIGIAIISISFSSMYNTANGVFMTIQLTIFSLINLLFKNNGITLMKEIISKHVKGLTVIFILFSLAMARGNLTTNISNSYIFAGIVVIISIIFSMFKKDN